jgi:geranylgeranyl diphosphate synthase type II
MDFVLFLGIMLDFKTAQEIIEKELGKFPLSRTPTELYDPVRYILSLGGKRIRPALTLMACSLFSDTVRQAVKPALAIEFFHNFTLLHDDLMDNSVLRRGKDTVHNKWNPNVAILSGDVMSILSYRILSEMEEESLKDILLLFNDTALKVCEGQQWDMNFEDRMDVTVAEYMNMIELKTAVLVAASLKAGAIMGGAAQSSPEFLYEFGRNLGIAFQIRDDYLDVYGDPGIFGKQIGNDILANKKTFLLVRALELSKGKLREELESWLSRKDPDPAVKVGRVTEIFTSLELDRISRELALEHHKMALQFLEKVDAPAEKKNPLNEFAISLMEREK